jgi:hypothetical protein
MANNLDLFAFQTTLTNAEPIFTDRFLDHEIETKFLESERPDENALKIVERWADVLSRGPIEEQQNKPLFLQDFFVELLGFVPRSRSSEWTINIEKSTPFDATTPDAELGYFIDDGNERNTRVIVEVKDSTVDLDRPQHRYNDKRTPVEQAFSYAPKYEGTVKWVVVTNFKEIRLYHVSTQMRYQAWNLLELRSMSQLLRFCFLLDHRRILSKTGRSKTDGIYKNRLEREKSITQEFYPKYGAIRLELLRNIRDKNSALSLDAAIQYTQKLLDRILFACFCQSTGALPSNVIEEVIEARNRSRLRTESRLWAELTALFTDIDQGYAEIPRFNGGLFAEDTGLNQLLIDDNVLLSALSLGAYDYASDLNVNIFRPYL